MTPRPRKKPSIPYRVYVTYLPDGRYYIGYSQKPDKQWEKYYGSARIIKEYKDPSVLQKELIAEYTTKSHAKMQEFLLQWQCRDDPLCINDMVHLRLRLSYLKNFTPIDWIPGQLSIKTNKEQ